MKGGIIKQEGRDHPSSISLSGVWHALSLRYGKTKER
jgi:hypothetical protein